jgi:hypothetical protein
MISPEETANIQYHIIGIDGHEYGPVDRGGLQAWIAQGKVNAQTQVRRAGETQWQTAIAMADIQPMLEPPVALPVTQAGDPSKAATAKTLVLTSHIMGYGGLLLMIVGVVVGLGFELAGIGVLSAIIGAILGQVGRGMQGRVI